VKKLKNFPEEDKLQGILLHEEKSYFVYSSGTHLHILLENVAFESID
jgi:hypothetical protein